MSTDFFKNKVVVITGGSDGIGKALVDALIPLGAKVATCARNQDKLYDLQLLHSGKPLHTIVADVSSYNDCKNFIDSTIEFFGGIDILINNAGISMRALVKDVDLEVIEKVMDINFNGTLYCTKLALDSIIKHKGSIVGVSSIAGYRGLPGRSGYSASKFAVAGFSESLRSELVRYGIDVTVVNPGLTKTNFSQNMVERKAKQSLDHMRGMTSETVAVKTLDALAKGKYEITLTVGGKLLVLLNRFAPRLVDFVAKRRVKKAYAGQE